jgi:hypothetical protein
MALPESIGVLRIVFISYVFIAYLNRLMNILDMRMYVGLNNLTAVAYLNVSFI